MRRTNRYGACSGSGVRIRKEAAGRRKTGRKNIDKKEYNREYIERKNIDIYKYKTFFQFF